MRQSELDRAVADVVRSQRFIMGPRVDELEQQLSERLRSKHAIACASGTDALLLSLKALDLRPDGEVVVPVARQVRDGDPVIVRLPEMDFVDDGPGKPVGIHRHIGRRPLAAFGNSDGDFEMLQWTTAGGGLRLGALVRHTDAEREWAYDRKSHVGRLERALDAAPAHGWTVIDMKRDWKKVFAFEK